MRKTTKQITIEDISISVEVRDRESETAWVFLHGWGSNKEVWRNVAQNLNQTIVTIDLPGFGSSDDLSKPWTIADYSEAVRTLISSLDHNSVLLVGHSFGGQIAVDIAADQPNWLAGLVLVGAAVVRDEEPKLLSAIGSILSPLFQLPGIKSLRPHIYNLIGADLPPEDDNLKQTMRTILREDQTDQLALIDVPTQIIWGSDDSDAPTENSEELLGKLSQANLSLLDGGHFIFIDAPDMFQQELINFHNQLQS